MAMASLVGCGGGGSASPIVPIVLETTDQTITQTNTHGVATALVNNFILANNPTVNYAATITNGFKFGQDSISYPVGTNRPSALAGGVNDVIDGKVELTWSVNSHLVTILLSDLDAISEAGLQSSAADAVSAIYKTY
jgi:hypothetical protein